MSEEKHFNGPERRKSEDGYFYCDAHNETSTALKLLDVNLKNLTESVNKIDKHLEEANKSKVAWWIAIAGIFATIGIQTFIFAFFIGQMSRQIDINTGRLTVIENTLYYHQGGNGGSVNH